MKNRPQMVARKVTSQESDFNRNVEAMFRVIERRIALIMYIVLLDKMDFGTRKLENYCMKVLDLKEKLFAGETSTEELLQYASLKHHNLYQMVKQIPFSQKLSLAKGNNKIMLGSEVYIEAALVRLFALMFAPLKSDYLTYAQLEEFWKQLLFKIDEYQSGHVSDQIIIESIKEYGYDPITGEKVNA